MIKVFAVMASVLAVELVAYWIFVRSTGFKLPNDTLGVVIGAFMTGIAANIAFAVGIKRDW